MLNENQHASLLNSRLPKKYLVAVIHSCRIFLLRHDYDLNKFSNIAYHLTSTLLFHCRHLRVILLLRFFRFVQNVCNLLCLPNKHYDDHVYLHEIQNDNIIFANLLHKKDDPFHRQYSHITIKWKFIMNYNSI